MSLIHSYTDAVLSPLVTEAIEATAIADVEALGEFPDPWPERLTVFRVYILLCLEYASTDDDPFSVKLPYYRAEWNLAMKDAQTARARATTGLFSIPLERA